MLREWIDSLRTDCPRLWRRLGYAYAAVACTARARRCAGAWAPHQERTRAAILEAAAACARQRRVLVLGAGPCLDIPLQALADRFAEVILADAAFPPEARRAAAPFGNVHLEKVELTGTAEALAAGRPMPRPGCTAFLDRDGIDLVVSANLLSQLPLLPLAARPGLGEGDLAVLGRAIVTAHLTHLRAFTCSVLLVSDVERRLIDRDGRLLSREDPLYGVPLPAGQEWVWDLAPPGELGQGHRLETTVRAVRLDGAPA